MGEARLQILVPLLLEVFTLLPLPLPIRPKVQHRVPVPLLCHLHHKRMDPPLYPRTHQRMDQLRHLLPNLQILSRHLLASYYVGESIEVFQEIIPLRYYRDELFKKEIEPKQYKTKNDYAYL